MEWAGEKSWDSSRFLTAPYLRKERREKRGRWKKKKKVRKGFGWKKRKDQKVQTVPEKIRQRRIRRTRRGQQREVKNRGAVWDVEFSSVVPKNLEPYFSYNSQIICSPFFLSQFPNRFLPIFSTIPKPAAGLVPHFPQFPNQFLSLFPVPISKLAAPFFFFPHSLFSFPSPL